MSDTHQRTIVPTGKDTRLNKCVANLYKEQEYFDRVMIKFMETRNLLPECIADLCVNWVLQHARFVDEPKDIDSEPKEVKSEEVEE